MINIFCIVRKGAVFRSQEGTTIIKSSTSLVVVVVVVAI